MIQPQASEIQDLVRQLHRQQTAWLPCGLGSRLDWGPPLRQPCELLSCARLDRIVEHNPGDFTLTVEAGTPWAVIQDLLAREQQWLALDPAWGSQPGQAGAPPAAAGSIGGLVARGLAGGYRQRWLGVRDQLLGLRLLRADGTEARAGGRVVKNVAGYDLMRLFCGSWGSLGLITELTLRTQPLPPCRRGLQLQGPLADMAALTAWLLGSSLSPERIDWWSPALSQAAGLPPRFGLLIGLASVDADSLNEQIGWLRERAASLSDNRLSAEELSAGALAERIAIASHPADEASAAQEADRADRTDSAAQAAQPDWLLRLGVAPARAAELLQRNELAAVPLELAAGSGLGLAWSGPDQLQPAQVSALRRCCEQLGGYLMLLRQPPQSSLAAWGDAPARPLIEALKQRFDPLRQLAPGRLPGVADPSGPVQSSPVQSGSIR